MWLWASRLYQNESRGLWSQVFASVYHFTLQVWLTATLNLFDPSSIRKIVILSAVTLVSEKLLRSSVRLKPKPINNKGKGKLFRYCSSIAANVALQEIFLSIHCLALHLCLILVVQCPVHTLFYFCCLEEKKNTETKLNFKSTKTTLCTKNYLIYSSCFFYLHSTNPKSRNFQAWLLKSSVYQLSFLLNWLACVYGFYKTCSLQFCTNTFSDIEISPALFCLF